MSKSVDGVSWVIGAGSGIGRAIAVRLARSGGNVVVSGRRVDHLDDVVQSIRAEGGRATALPVDVADAEAMRTAHLLIARDHGHVGVLIFAAGLNTPERWWESLTAERFQDIVNVNLNGAVNSIVPVLPGMREAGGGTIVLVGSWSGWRFMSVASAAYSASKSGLAALVETLNDQEGRSGIRATHLVPAEVDTEIAATRPVPPTEDERKAMLDPDDIARVTQSIIELPRHVCINEIVISGVLNGIYLRDSYYKGEVRVAGRRDLLD